MKSELLICFKIYHDFLEKNLKLKNFTLVKGNISSLNLIGIMPLAMNGLVNQDFDIFLIFE